MSSRVCLLIAAGLCLLMLACRDNVGRLEQSCEQGNVDDCAKAGRRYLSPGSGVVSDFGKAGDLCRRGCDGGGTEACLCLGEMYEEGRQYSTGKGIPQDHGKAVKLYQKVCNEGLAGGCHKLGGMYQFGKGVTRNNGRAAELYSKACDGGSTGGCTSAGLLYSLGGGNVRRDVTKAKSLFKRACDAEDSMACGMLKGMKRQ